MPSLLRLALVTLCATAGARASSRERLVLEYLLAENRVLRELLGSRRVRLCDDQRRRLAVRASALGRAALTGLSTLVQPETLLRWYRDLVARPRTTRGGRGRPRRRGALRELIATMARDNPSWGYTRIRGALAHLGHEVGRNTIRRVLADAGLGPSPEREGLGRWRLFLRAQWSTLAAADFFQVRVWTVAGPVRYAVLVGMRLETRRVHIAGVVRVASSTWMQAAAARLVDPVSGFLRGARTLIHDRDSLFDAAFRAALAAAGITTKALPPGSPNLNAYCERFICSVRRECLRHVVVLGPEHLRAVLDDYVEHYHRERSHQGLGNRLIDGAPIPARAANDNGYPPVRRRTRLGGVLSYYHREAG